MHLLERVLSVILVAATCGGVAAQPSGPGGEAARPPIAARTGELVNPDGTTMVFLYYDLAGIPVPVDRLVEEDTRVQFAQGVDKGARRAEVRPEIESGIAAVRGIGVLRLSLDAGLSPYDPTYGEFSVGALAPSSLIPFEAFKQKVSVRFGNARTAQSWKVPEAEAGLIRDKLGPGTRVTMDVMLKITGVQPGSGGGTIVADVVEYELRESRTGATIGRVQVGKP